MIELYSDYEFIDEQKHIRRIVNEAKKVKQVSIDTETTGLDLFDGSFKLLLFQIEINNKAYVIDVRKVDITPFKVILEDKNILKIVQNGNYDYKVIKMCCKMRIINMYDTYIAEVLQNVGGDFRSSSLGSLVHRYLGFTMDKSEGSEFPNFDYENGEFTNEQKLYAARDVLVLPDVKRYQIKGLQTSGLMETANLEFSIIESVAMMELTGILLDADKWRISLETTKENAHKLATELIFTLPQDPMPERKPPNYNKDGSLSKRQPKEPVQPVLNLNSWQQVANKFLEIGVDLRECNEITRAGITNVNNLKYAIGKYGGEPKKTELLHKFVDWRGYNQVLKTFGTGLLDHIRSDGRIHAKFDPLGTDSGRFSSSNPNLQNIQKKGAEGKMLRSCFIAPPNYKYVVVDYSQIELRIAAEISGDEKMIGIFQDPTADLHTATAALMFDVPYEQVENEPDKIMRKAAKTINFGIIYGMGIGTLAERVECTVERAKELMEIYKGTYCDLIEWITNEGAAAVKRGWSKTIGGRYRYFPKLSKGKTRDDWNEWRRLTSHYENVGKNHPIQGTSADMTKSSIAMLYEPLRKYNATLVNTVHDEVCIETPKKNALKTAQLIRDKMVEAGEKYLQRVPILVDVKISNCWYSGGEDVQSLEELELAVN